MRDLMRISVYIVLFLISIHLFTSMSQISLWELFTSLISDYLYSILMVFVNFFSQPNVIGSLIVMAMIYWTFKSLRWRVLDFWNDSIEPLYVNKQKERDVQVINVTQEINKKISLLRTKTTQRIKEFTYDFFLIQKANKLHTEANNLLKIQSQRQKQNFSILSSK